MLINVLQCFYYNYNYIAIGKKHLVNLAIMDFFFSRAKLLLSNCTSSLESLCNAREGGLGDVLWIKVIAKEIMQGKSAFCLAHVLPGEEVNGRARGPESRVGKAGTTPLASFPGVAALQHQAGSCCELCLQQHPRALG